MEYYEAVRRLVKSKELESLAIFAVPVLLVEWGDKVTRSVIAVNL